MRTRNRAHESFEVSFMQCVLYWFCVFYSLPLLYCVWQRWNWTKRSCVAYWTRLINPPPRVNPWGHVIWQSWTECQYKGDAVLPLLLSLLLSLSEDTLLWYKQRHLPAECGQTCEFFLSLCCAAFSTHHQFPRVTGWLRLTSSKTAPLINILAARHYLSTPSMSSGSPFLALGQAPGHASLFEACLLRCSSTRSQNIPWSIIDELGNLLASTKRVIEGSNVATLVHKEQICIQVEHMPKVQSCIHIVKPWNTHTHTSLQTDNWVSFLSITEVWATTTQDSTHERVGGWQKVTLLSPHAVRSSKCAAVKAESLECLSSCLYVWELTTYANAESANVIRLKYHCSEGWKELPPLIAVATDDHKDPFFKIQRQRITVLWTSSDAFVHHHNKTNQKQALKGFIT